MNKNGYKGFTLIELMVTIAIVGILAVIAVPAYQYYITKARYSELVVAGTEMKARVSECLILNSCNTLDETVGRADRPLSSIVASVNTKIITQNKAIITVTPTATNDAGISTHQTLHFTGTLIGSHITWDLCAKNGAHKYVAGASAVCESSSDEEAAEPPSENSIIIANPASTILEIDVGNLLKE